MAKRKIPNRYDKIKIGEYSDGSPKFITWGVKVLLYHAERLAGEEKSGAPWTTTQGCFHAGNLSANTHLGADIIDTSHFAEQRRLKAIKDMGGFGWIRDGRDSADFAEPNWHIHWGIKNSRHMDPSAVRQKASYLGGRNGLLNNAVDRYEYRTDRQFHYKNAYNNMMDEIEEGRQLERAQRILKNTKKGSKLHTAILRFILRFRGKPKSDH